LYNTVQQKRPSTTRVDYTGLRSPMSSYIAAKYKDLEGVLGGDSSATRRREL